MTKKINRAKLSNMDAVEVYKLVLDDTIKRFPRGFWESEESIENANKCVRYLIEEKYRLNDKEIKEQFSTQFLKNNKLRGMLDTCFNRSPFEVINNAYPGRFREWEFKNTPNKYWVDKQNGINATKYLIEEKLKLSDKELKRKLNVKLFNDNGLGAMLLICFNSSPYQAISETYPERNYQVWDFRAIPKGFWQNKENGIRATKYLIEEKLKLNEEEVIDKLSRKLFVDNGLGGMLKYCFNNSPYNAINSAYPEKNYKPWQLKNVPINYWSKDRGALVIKWFIEEELKLNEEQIKELLSVKLFKKHRLWGMIQICFNGSYFDAINYTYPNRFKKEEFKNYYHNLPKKEKEKFKKYI